MFFKKIRNYKKTLIFHLTLLYALIFIVSTSITFLIFYLRIYSVTMDSLDDELKEEVKSYISVMEDKGIEEVMNLVKEESQSGEHNEEFFRLVNFNGDTLISTDMSLWGSVKIENIQNLKSTDVGFLFNTLEIPDLESDARIITAMIGNSLILQIGETLEEADEYLAIFRNLFFVLLLVLFFISVLIGRYLAGRALIDMEEVTYTAQQISKGLFEQRVLLKGRFEEIKRLGATFNKMLDHIELLLRSMKDINDNIAHDLRSPLARIRGFAEMALMGDKSDEDYKDMAINTMEECDALIDIINTMLDITEAEAGVQEVKEESIDLVPLISDAFELFQPIADEKKITLNSNFPPRLVFRGDRRKMQRVITNLLENAIKYTPENGTVKASGSEKDGKIQVFFEDTGIGISEADLPHIFERFYRCDRSRSQGGVGLGLCLAKAYVETMKGNIIVDSTVNKGSKFTLQFAQLMS